MKIKVDMKKLAAYMKDNCIESLPQLAKESGLDTENAVRELNRRGTISKESLWLISDRLGVPINAFVYPDWSESVSI